MEVDTGATGFPQHATKRCMPTPSSKDQSEAFSKPVSLTKCPLPMPSPFPGPGTWLRSG